MLGKLNELLNQRVREYRNATDEYKKTVLRQDIESIKSLIECLDRLHRTLHDENSGGAEVSNLVLEVRRRVESTRGVLNDVLVAMKVLDINLRTQSVCLNK